MVLACLEVYRMAYHLAWECTRLRWMCPISARATILSVDSEVLRDGQRPHQIPQVHPGMLGQMTGPILLLVQAGLREWVMMGQTGNPIFGHYPGAKSIRDCTYIERDKRI